MDINRKVLISVAAIVVALFVISNPLGDTRHGLGRHNTILAVLGQSLFVASLIGAALLIAFAVTAVLQRGLRSRRARG